MAKHSDRFLPQADVIVGDTYAATVLTDDGGPFVRVQFVGFQGNREMIRRDSIRLAEPSKADLQDAIEFSKLVPVFEGRTPEAPIVYGRPRQTDAERLATLWTTINPKTRKRIERASRALAVSLDLLAETELAK